MIPTIQIGDNIIINKYAYSTESIKRFDIVVFHAPNEKQINKDVTEKAVFVKRIIGLPNEKIEIKDNKIFINGKLLDENFEKITDETDQMKNFPALVIPENEYFLMGDNRPNSEDSRYWKKPTVSKDDILGQVVEIIAQND
jgi:signal peptidase I